MTDHERPGGAVPPRPVPEGAPGSGDETAPPSQLPGPTPPVPDLAAVSASIDPPSAAPAAPSAVLPPAVMRPTADVAAVPSAPRVPGAPAPDYGRLPTAPVATMEQGPREGEVAEWAPVEPAPVRPFIAAWALGLAVVALVASFAVGWMLPLGLVAIVVAIVALRRPVERRAIAVWAIVLGAMSIVYSAGWLLWAAWIAGMLG